MTKSNKITDKLSTNPTMTKGHIGGLKVIPNRLIEGLIDTMVVASKIKEMMPKTINAD